MELQLKFNTYIMMELAYMKYLMKGHHTVASYVWGHYYEGTHSRIFDNCLSWIQ